MSSEEERLECELTGLDLHSHVYTFKSFIPSTTYKIYLAYGIISQSLKENTNFEGILVIFAYRVLQINDKLSG